MPNSVNSAIVGRLIPALILLVEKRVVSKDDLDLTQLKYVLTKASDYMDYWTLDQILEELIRLLNDTYPMLKDYTSIVVFFIAVRKILSIATSFDRAAAYSIEKVADIIDYMA